MSTNEKQPDDDIIDVIDDEELQKLVLEAQREALSNVGKENMNPRRKRPFIKWILWLMSFVLVINTFVVIFEIYSIPALEFLKTSARLSSQEDIALYKKSVVVIATNNSKGTGFSISADGIILTNNHVVEGNKKVVVEFPDHGHFTADIVQAYPDIDLAIIKVNAADLPFLQLAKQPDFEAGEPIYFIGNPLRFTGIANEGTLISELKLASWEEPVMMMKAPVYRGNSGSPVLNEDGEVIGIVFATLKHELHGKVGLFIPVDLYWERTLSQ
ncbi:serine protease [Bacillus sp. FJAT-50079]|uniref:S1C family serine protease n=1 Tax=Bacillus sp. FJAT-50079 TaxID=2833577 RepID=UPI001BCA084C|nr:serine protease [Bacillus sp. FJAT-50079]MBS4210226.1 trypsin-like peptidase domain-containing protein [Bacillus sp. FJAT-50079]